MLNSDSILTLDISFSNLEAILFYLFLIEHLIEVFGAHSFNLFPYYMQ